MVENEYSQKLKDPRWQKKRLKILERDNWTCQKCFDTKSTLVVHHRLYVSGVEPWEYPDRLLITLCENCHEKEFTLRPEAEGCLLDSFRRRFFADEVYSFAVALDQTPKNAISILNKLVKGGK